MSHYIQLIISLIEAHAYWGLAIVFLVGLGESVFVLGLFVPSTAVLVGAGTLVGSGNLPFVPIFMAASLGAIIGDAISYWIGKTFGERIRQFWPFNRYSGLIDKGEAYFLLHGGKSIFIGRFIPMIKAVVPGVAGIVGMDVVRFSVINVVSAFAWAAAHLLPGMGIGKGIGSLAATNHDDHLVIIGTASMLLLAGWLALRTVKRIAARVSKTARIEQPTSPKKRLLADSE